MRFNRFIIAELVPTKSNRAPVGRRHPLVVEVDYVAVRAIVHDERNNLALAIGEF